MQPGKLSKPSRTMKIDPEAAAFPLPENRSYDSEYGLTKREYFAAAALQGIMASCVRPLASYEDAEQVASAAVIAAEALIRILNR